MRKPLIWMSAIILLQFAAISGISQAGTDIKTPQTISFSSLLTFFGQPIRDVFVKVTPQQQLLIRYDSIQPFLVRRLDRELISRIEAQLVDGYLDSEVLNTYNITIHLSAKTFETNIEIPTERLVDSGLYLFEQSARNASYQESSPFSGYLNAFLAIAHNDFDESDQEWSSDNTFETGLRYNKLNFTTDFSVDSDSSQTDVYRLESQFTYDFPEDGTRVTLGDHSFRTFGLQGGTELLGININRNFDVIPTKNVRPLTSQRFVIDRTSTVELFIDGVLLRRLQLAPGAYDIRDIPLATGVNNIELVITDPSGRREVLFFNIASGVNLLAKGESEYSLSFGINSSFVSNELEYDADDKVISAGVDYGLTENATLGLNTQGRDNIYQFGGTAGFATMLGLFGVDIAFSDYQGEEPGYATRLNYDAFFLSDVHSFNAQYEYRSAEFINVSDNDFEVIITDESREEHHLDTFYSYRFENDWVLGLSANVSQRYNGNVNYALSGSLAGFWPDSIANWNLRVIYDDDDIEDNDEYRLFLSTSIPIGFLFNNNHQMNATYESERNRYQTQYSYNNNSGTVGGVGVFASLESNEQDKAIGNVSADYTGNRYVLTLDHDSLLNEDDTYSYGNRLGLQSALAFTSNRIAVGRPINDGYAIITTHSSLKDSQVVINPGRDGSYAARSDFLGPLLIPDIVSYRPQRIEYDVENLPIGYDLGEGGFSINPYHRSGYLLTIGSAANITAMGYILDARGKPIPLTEGLATHTEDGDFAPIDFFTNSKGRYAITGLKPGTYSVTLYSAVPVEFTMTIPEDEGNIIRMGEIREEK